MVAEALGGGEDLADNLQGDVAPEPDVTGSVDLGLPTVPSTDSTS